GPAARASRTSVVMASSPASRRLPALRLQTAYQASLSPTRCCDRSGPDWSPFTGWPGGLLPHHDQHRVGRPGFALAVGAEHGESVVARLQVLNDEPRLALGQLAHLLRAVVQFQLLPAFELRVVHGDGYARSGVKRLALGAHGAG